MPSMEVVAVAKPAMPEVVARLVHPVGLVHDKLQSPLRGLGAGVTLLITLISAAMAILQFYAE